MVAPVVARMLAQRFGPSVLKMGEQAQASLARMAGLQTPAAKQAAGRLMEPELAAQAARSSGIVPRGLELVRNNPGSAAAMGAAAATPMALGFLPQRAEGDPAGAINRRTAPQFTNVNVPLPPDEMPNPQDVITRQVVAEGYEPGYFGDAGRRMSGAVAAMQPEPGYSGAAGRAISQAARDYGFKMSPTTTGSTARPAAAAAPAMSGREDYQSTSQRVVERPQGPTAGGAPQRAVLNWGDEGSAADFFRADKAMRELEKNKEEFVGRASGGRTGAGAGGKDAAIHKALEIIHHLLTRR